MKNQYREIEKKFKVDPSKEYNLGSLSYIIENTLKLIPNSEILKVTDCQTKDYYYKTKSKKKILRLRDSWGTNNKGFSECLQEITVKRQDKSTIEDRFELNFKFKVDNLENAYNFLQEEYGEPLGIIQKSEVIFFLPFNTVISLCRVINDNNIYLEIEAESLEAVEVYQEALTSKIQCEKQYLNFFDTYLK